MLVETWNSKNSGNINDKMMYGSLKIGKKLCGLWKVCCFFQQIMKCEKLLVVCISIRSNFGTFKLNTQVWLAETWNSCFLLKNLEEVNFKKVVEQQFSGIFRHNFYEFFFFDFARNQFFDSFFDLPLRTFCLKTSLFHQIHPPKFFFWPNNLEANF
jgi:hypothetical protein